MSKKAIVTILCILFVVLMVLCGVAVLRDARPKDPVFIVPSPTAGSPVVTPKTTLSPSVDEGAWLVGTDIKPGTYRSPGATEGYCAWVVRKNQDQDAEVVAVGTADKPNEPQRVALKSGQVFETTGCRPWVKQ